MPGINRLYRRAALLKMNFLSTCRKINFRLKYPSLKIDSATWLGRNVTIRCTDGADCMIRGCHIGDGSLIVVESGAILKMTGSSFGPNCVVVARMHVEVMKNCSIAEMVVIRDQDHEFGGEKLIRDSGYKVGKIIIEENVWIGAKATVLKDVTIGRDSVVGANSVVNKSFPQRSLIAGIPAQLIRNL
jgi:carbonic anhydrase/acetyltransferase-like protein (isoleucine patch superfamily)